MCCRLGGVATTCALNMDWLSPSGGAIWHLRALRYRRHWGPFLQAIEQWLDAWQHGKRHLLLLGPSAGWCLPSAFLARFESIHAVDIDPWVPYLFALRHGKALRRAGTRITWQRADFFLHAKDLLNQYREHAVLFPNVLGQHALHVSDSSVAERDLAKLVMRLRGRTWASFHERLSGRLADAQPDLQTRELPGRLSAEALAQRIAMTGVWSDHSTTDVFPAECPRLLLAWVFRPGHVHWIEAAHP